MRISNPFLSINVEVLLIFLGMSTPFLIHLLNKDLLKFVKKNRIIQYIILFILAHITTRFYNKDFSNTINFKHLFWSLLITIIFIIINKLDYRIILLFLSITCVAYTLFILYNTYKTYYK